MLSYFRDYQKGDIDKLKEINSYRPNNELVEYTKTIEAYFNLNLPASIVEASSFGLDSNISVNREKLKEFSESQLIGSNERKC